MFPLSSGDAVMAHCIRPALPLKSVPPMHPILSPTDIHQIYLALGREKLHPENAVRQLVDKGYEEEMARSLVSKLVKEQQTAVFKENIRVRKLEERRKASFLIIFLIAVAGPVSGTTIGLWYIVAAVAAGLAGHFGRPDKPASAIVGGVSLVLLFPCAWTFYMQDPSSSLSLELLIPLLMAAVPAYFLSILAGRLFDNHRKS